MSNLEFKHCEFFDPFTGVCKKAKFLPEIKEINPYSVGEYQCCYMMPPGTALYDCPNPKINPDISNPIDESIQEPLHQTDNSLNINNYETEVLIRLINELRQDMEVLIANQQQELHRIVEPLINRIKKLEENEHKKIQKISLLPNGDIPRPRPTIRTSEKAKKDLEFTNPTEAEKQFEQQIINLEINEEILNENFFEDILIDVEEDLFGS